METADNPIVPGRERWTGTIFIFLSTVCYGLSNTLMRLLTEYKVDNDWILFFKESTGLLLLIPWLLLRFFQGRYRWISKRLILYVAVGSVLCELIGARLHLFGFSVLGLVVAIPLIQSSTLLGTAFLGRIVLGDPLSRRRKTAIAVLIVAVITLGVGKELLAVKPAPVRPGQTSEIPVFRPETTSGTSESTSGDTVGLFLLAVLGTIAAGTAYSIYIVTIRYSVRKYWNDGNSAWLSFQFTQWAGFDYPKESTGLSRRPYAPFPVTLTMSVVLGVGIVTFGACLFGKRGLEGFYDVPDALWPIVVTVGLCNVVGFFFQVQGLRMTTAVQASIIAVSQILVLSLIGLFFFREPINVVVFAGLVLTACGVLMSARPERPTAPSAPDPGRDQAGRFPSD